MKSGREITVFVQPVTDFTGLHGTLSLFAKPTRLHEPLRDANRVCRTSTSLHEPAGCNACVVSCEEKGSGVTSPNPWASGSTEAL